jgi:hypothetical protein
MLHTNRHIVLIACCGLALIAFVGFGYSVVHSSKEIALTNERELKVNVQAGFGDISLSRGKSDAVVTADMNTDENAKIDDCLEYNIRDHVGYLDLSTDCKLDDSGNRKHGKSIHVDRLDSRKWSMQFTDAVPISFDIELGLGRGDIDMTNLAVKDFSLSCGASSVQLRFDRPNKEEIENMSIEAGVSKFEANGLCNARFHRLKFDGGVGSYLLDFGGPLDREVQADIDVGLGSLTIIVPEQIGAKIVYEKSWICHLTIDHDFTESSKEDNAYFSSNYYSAKGRINLRVDAGLGSVKVRRER